MNKSVEIKDLALSLSKFQGEVTNPKNSAKNPQFNSKYAPLQDILSLVRPLLSKQGLSILQSTTGDLENVTISTMLLHESGQFMETEPFILKGEQTAKGGVKVLNVQGAGSMITYIRRYQISAILGLASEDDDDGNHASNKKEPNEDDANKEAEKLRITKIGVSKVQVIKGLLSKSNSDEKNFLKWAKVDKVEDIINGNFKVVADTLHKALEKYELENNKNEMGNF